MITFRQLSSGETCYTSQHPIPGWDTAVDCQVHLSLRTALDSFAACHPTYLRWCTVALFFAVMINISELNSADPSSNR